MEFINAKGRGCHIFKKDLRRAYRQIPIDPADYRLLGMCIDGSIYFHTLLPFGLRSATLICQRTTKSVVHILNNEGISVDVYIDDFYGTESPSCSNQSFQRMNSLFTELGLLASPEKDVPPCHQMLCLGIWIDTLDMTLSVPAHYKFTPISPNFGVIKYSYIQAIVLAIVDYLPKNPQAEFL